MRVRIHFQSMQSQMKKMNSFFSITVSTREKKKVLTIGKKLHHEKISSQDVMLRFWKRGLIEIPSKGSLRAFTFRSGGGSNSGS